MMVLTLDGQSIEGYGIVVNAEMAMPADDLSGQTSSSNDAELGFKPKRLKIKLFIRYEDKGQLRALIKLAEATQGNGKRKIYTIVNDTATAVGVRQVRFGDRITAQEQEDSDAWTINFTLIEHLSAPEKVESTELPAPTPAEMPPAEAKATADVATSSPTWLEANVLAPLDSMLADDTDSSTEIG